MGWTDSRIYTAFLTDVLNNTTAMDLNTDASLSVALFGTTPTPDRTVASSSTAYGAGVWASGGVFDASGWPAVGRDLASVTSQFSAGVYTFDAADTVSANDTTTLSAAFGCLVYDNTIATPVVDQGICFSYFGGTQSVSSGRFTVSWHGSGIFTLTV